MLAAQLPALDESACARCGACLHGCPTEVFSQSVPQEARLVKSADALPEQVIAVVCPLHPAPDRSVAPGAIVLRHTRCLVGLGCADLLALAQDGRRTVWLDDAPCANCPLAVNQAEIARHAHEASALLSAAGKPVAVRCASTLSAPTARPAARPVVDGSQPRVTRRGLLRAFLPPATEAPGPDEPPEPEPTRWSHGKRFPPQRRALLRRLRRWTARDADAVAPFPSVRIDEGRCSACELCARFCPTDALHFTTDGDGFSLAFEAARCVGCSICVMACPEDAVMLDASMAFAVLTGDPVTVAVGNLLPCSGCGAQTAHRPRDAQPTCHACRYGAGAVRPLQDGIGLVADLLRREQKLHSQASFEGPNNDG